MEIKDRISEFIQYKNITIAEFERNVSLANGYIKKFKGSIGSDKLSNIISYYPDININWLITGEGSMLKSENSNMVAEPLVEYGKKQTKPRIPYTAAAGSLTSAVEGITADQCEQIPRINIFPE